MGPEVTTKQTKVPGCLFSMDYFRIMRSVAAESIISSGLRIISEKKLVCWDPVYKGRLWLEVEESELLPADRSEELTLQVANLMCH